MPEGGQRDGRRGRGGRDHYLPPPRAGGDGPASTLKSPRALMASPRPRGWTRNGPYRTHPTAGFPAPAGSLHEGLDEHGGRPVARDPVGRQLAADEGEDASEGEKRVGCLSFGATMRPTAEAGPSPPDRVQLVCQRHHVSKTVNFGAISAASQWRPLEGDLLEDRAVMVHSMLNSDRHSTGRFGSVADPAGVLNRDVTAMLDAPPCRPSQRVAIPAAPSDGGAHDGNTLYLPGNGTVGGHLGMGSRRNGTTAIHAHGRPQDRRRAEHTSLLLRSGRRVRARPSCSRRESATACPFPNPS